MSGSTVVILGAGQAGFQTAASLRDNGFDGRIALIGNEAELPYQRPPLSKAYLIEPASPPGVHLRPHTFYATHEIELIDDGASSIDRAAKQVHLASGASLSYDHLVLALGARVRPLKVPGTDHDGVLYLRSVADARLLRERLRSARHLVVVGAGFIGLEVAAAAAKLGLATTILDVMPRVLSRSASEPMALYLADQHAGWGNTIMLGTGIAGIHGQSSKVTGVATTDGRTLPADIVLIGIGVIPNVELADAAGLPVADGIVVDDHLRTSDPAISAIGDCARFPSRFTARPTRLESVQNAVDQGRCVAARLTGRTARYDSVPWFWSDQGPLKLQIVGLTDGHDHTVMRGHPAENRFSVFCYRGQQLVGIESINRAADHVAGRRLLAQDISLTPQQAADMNFDLKALTGRVPAPVVAPE